MFIACFTTLRFSYFTMDDGLNTNDEIKYLFSVLVGMRCLAILTDSQKIELYLNIISMILLSYIECKRLNTLDSSLIDFFS